MLLLLLHELFNLLLYIFTKTNNVFGYYQVSKKVPSLILTRKSQASGPHKNLFYSLVTYKTAISLSFTLRKANLTTEALFLSDF